ncbi:MAG: hypothetical protein Q9223_002678 [Gallowayella weberi]
MFDFLTPSKPRNTHARSQSTPYLQPSPNHPYFHHNGLKPTHYSHQHTDPQPPSLTHPPADLAPSQCNPPYLPTQRLHRTRPSLSTGKLSDWFTGESEPIPFAIIPSPTKEKLNPVDEMTSFVSAAAPSAQEKPLIQRETPRPPFISRFSLFASKQRSPRAPIAPADVHDHWHDLDVKTALVPSGVPDPFSPSEFKNLQQNAEGLLSRLQAAYKHRSQVLHDVLAEKEAQSEEFQGAEMRSRHLQLQLDDMTKKLAQQDQAMMDLVDQLAQEKQAHREADAVRRRSNNTKSNEESHRQGAQHTRRPSKSRTSTASEMSLASEDSSVESLFSRQGATSPTMSMSSISTMNSPDSTSLHHPSASAERYDRRCVQSNAESRCQAAESRISDDKMCSSPQSASMCANCSGLNNSEAWNLVNILKLENQGLKTRLGQLENTVDDCLDMVKSLF